MCSSVMNLCSCDLLSTINCPCSVHIILGKETPSGCIMQTVGDKCEVHMMLRGLVDVAREISRLQEKITKLSIQLDKLQTAMAAEGYEQKVQNIST